MKDSKDVMTCLSLDGKTLWQTPIGDAWSGPFPDTRTTPTVDGDQVYAISGNGTIACLETSSGKVIWSLDGVKTFDGVYGTWGVCESPLIFGEKLIYTPAGNKTTLVALDKMTGKTIWMSESLRDTTAYVSPRVIRQGNKDIIVTLTERWFFGAEANSGKILWKYDFASLLPEKGLEIWPGAPRTNTNTPLFDNGMIYITGGYDHAGSMFRLSENGDAIAQVWIDTVLDCHHGGVVKVGDYIYGSNWLDNSKGNWCCLDWKTGKTMYETKWFTKGAIISAGNMLYCFDEKNGNLGLVRATPEKFDLAGSLKVTLGKGPFWAHPTIYNGLLIVRHGDVLVVYKMI
jgi:outer membrane protein assembly factor BamB